MSLKSITLKEFSHNEVDGKHLTVITLAGIKIPKLEEIAKKLAEEVGCHVWVENFEGIKIGVEYSAKTWTLWERIKFLLTNKI